MYMYMLPCYCIYTYPPEQLIFFLKKELSQVLLYCVVLHCFVVLLFIMYMYIHLYMVTRNFNIRERRVRVVVLASLLV